MSHKTGIKYGGTALPSAAATVNLFSTVTCFPGASAIQMLGFSRFLLDLVCDHDCTLKWYKSQNRGSNWLLLDTLAVTGAANTSTIVDFLVEEYEDWKLDCLVGASTMTVFNPSMVLTSERAQG